MVYPYSNDQIKTAVAEINDNMKHGDRPSYDGDLYETNKGNFFFHRSADKWYRVDGWRWEDAIEIPAPAKTWLNHWTREGDKNRPHYINFVGLPVDPQERALLRARRERLGLSQPQFGRLLGLSGPNADRTVRRWEDGETPVPGTVAALLALMDQTPGAVDVLRRRAGLS